MIFCKLGWSRFNWICTVRETYTGSQPERKETGLSFPSSCSILICLWKVIFASFPSMPLCNLLQTGFLILWTTFSHNSWSATPCLKKCSLKVHEFYSMIYFFFWVFYRLDSTSPCYIKPPKKEMNSQHGLVIFVLFVYFSVPDMATNKQVSVSESRFNKHRVKTWPQCWQTLTCQLKIFQVQCVR